MPFALPTASIEGEIQARLVGTQLNSVAFHRGLNKALTHYSAKLSWSKAFGDTDYRVGEIYCVAGPRHINYSTVIFWQANQRLYVQMIEASERVPKRDPLIRKPGNECGLKDQFILGQSYRRGSRLIRCGEGGDGDNPAGSLAALYILQSGVWHLQDVKDAREYRDPGTYFERKRGTVNPNMIIVHTEWWTQNTFADIPDLERWNVGATRISLADRVLYAPELLDIDEIAGVAKSGKHRRFDKLVAPKLRAILWKSFREDSSLSEIDTWHAESRQLRIELRVDKPGTYSSRHTIVVRLVRGKWRPVSLLPRPAN